MVGVVTPVVVVVVEVDDEPPPIVFTAAFRSVDNDGAEMETCATGAMATVFAGKVLRAQLSDSGRFVASVHCCMEFMNTCVCSGHLWNTW